MGIICDDKSYKEKNKKIITKEKEIKNNKIIPSINVDTKRKKIITKDKEIKGNEINPSINIDLSPSNVQVEFMYNSSSYIIYCKEDEKMEKICSKFLSKENLDENQIFYLYDGLKISKFDKNLTFNQVANSIDKTRKKMDIIVKKIEMETLYDENKIINAKNIICPKCKENIKMKIINYKINLFECKNNHKINDLSFEEFKKSQIINLNNIKCGFCKDKNKANTFNNEFYKCFECNKNICPLCKLNHDKNHNIYNHDKIYYICGQHNESYTYYCNECKINICTLCLNEHSGHDKILIADIMHDKNDLIKQLNDFKNKVNKFNNTINDIISSFNIVKDNLDNYYKLVEYLINNYEPKERNYEILYIIDKIAINNKEIVKDINNINSNDLIKIKIKKIFDIYNKLDKLNKIDSNEIKMTINVLSPNQKIYFLDNTYGSIYINGKNEKHYHDFLNELNESNVLLYINNKKYKFKKYFIPDKEGTYEILLKFQIQLKNCSFMFWKCENITNLDLSSFDTRNVTDMSYMFYGSHIGNIELSSIDTQNVTNMSYMFYNSRIGNLDLSSFDTQNVVNMSYMFYGSDITYLDLSSFDTQNVTNMSYMFGGCSNLKNIHLSSFNTKNVVDMECMFLKCSNLKNVDLSSFNTQNVTSMHGLFNGCSNLINIDLSSFNTQNVISIEYMFNNCYNLSKIDLSSFNTLKIKDIKCIFQNCNNLEKVKLNKNLTHNIQDQINSCKIQFC